MTNTSHNHSSAVAQPAAQAVAARGGAAAALELLQHLPPEAIIEVVQVVGEVVRAHTALRIKHHEFLLEMERFRETNTNRERLMTKLSELLLGAGLNDEAKLKIVDTICQLALR